MSETAPDRPKTALDRFLNIADVLAIASTWVAGGCLVALSMLMLAQISVAAASRIFPAIRGDIPVAWEYGSYLMGATFMLGLAMTLRAGRHIRLGLITDRAGPRVRTIMDIAVSLIALALMSFLTFSLGQAAFRSWMTGSSSIASRTPLWIPLLVFTAGSFLMSLELVARILSGLAGRPVEDPSLRVESVEGE